MQDGRKCVKYRKKSEFANPARQGCADKMESNIPSHLQTIDERHI